MNIKLKLRHQQGLYIGCMTGTSIDRYADFVAAVFDQKTGLPTAHETLSTEIPSALRAKLLSLSMTDYPEISREHRYKTELALTDFLATAYIKIIKQLQLDEAPKCNIILSPHGQTIHHAPLAQPPICDVLLDPQALANKTGYQVVGYHRQKVLPISMAAPLAPALIKHLFADKKQPTVLLNGGGIANICVLPATNDINANNQLIAYDTGPANGPLDSIVQYVLNNTPKVIPKNLFNKIKKYEFDYQGLWAQQGQCQQPLLEKLLQHEYFSRNNSEKSADRADFGIKWVISANKKFNYSWADVLATTSELIAQTIEQAIVASLLATSNSLCRFGRARVISYGGLTHNQFIISRLEAKLKVSFISMTQLGYNPDNFEALLMAYLGFCVKNNKQIDLAYCKRASILSVDAKAVPGEIFHPNKHR